MRAARPDVERRRDDLETERAADATATARPTVVARPSLARSTLLKVWLPIPLLLLLFDVTFPLWFWRVPKLTPVTADYGYQFLVDAHDLNSHPPAPDALRVLAVGSSIAGSFDPTQVQSLLHHAIPDRQVDVRRLLLPGIKPSDLRLFFATEGAALRPDVVAVLLNPLDFLNPSFERDLKPQVRYVLPPWETLRERSAFIPTLSGKLDLAVASVSNLYRYRKLIRSSLEDHARLGLQWLRGGTPARGYGWYADGYTKQDFGLPLDSGAALDLEYYIAPSWLAQRGAVTLQFATARGVLARQTETEPGWKTIHLALPSGHGPLLHVSADSAWSPRAAGLGTDTRLLGVQLHGVRGDASRTAHAPLHYPPLDRDRLDELLRMHGAQGDEFVARWQALLGADNEFGHRFRAYRDAKVAARDEPVGGGGEYTELERLVELLAARGATVVLVNNPESALMRALYEDSPYYRSYVAFLQQLTARTPRAQFADLRAELPIDDFNDWHHATYVGQIKMGPIYAERLRGVLADTARQRRGGT
jgi:hypothetical protein